MPTEVIMAVKSREANINVPGLRDQRNSSQLEPALGAHFCVENVPGQFVSRPNVFYADDWRYIELPIRTNEIRWRTTRLRWLHSNVLWEPEKARFVYSQEEFNYFWRKAVAADDEKRVVPRRERGRRGWPPHRDLCFIAQFHNFRRSADTPTMHFVPARKRANTSSAKRNVCISWRQGATTARMPVQPDF